MAGIPKGVPVFYILYVVNVLIRLHRTAKCGTLYAFHIVFVGGTNIMKAKKLISSVLLGAMLATAPMTAFASSTLTLNLGSRVATMNENTIVMQNAAGVTEEGIIMVPVRAVAEAYGGTVVYDGEANTVRMDFPNGNWAEIEIIMEDTADNTAEPEKN